MNTYLIRVLRKFNFLKHINITGRIELNDKSFKIPILKGIGFSNLFMSEPWMIELLKHLLPLTDGCFVDVGMNIGQTMIKLRSVSKDKKYIGFEPNPYCMNYLNDLCQANDFLNITMIPVGVSNSTTILELNFYSDNSIDSAASIVPNFRPEQKVYNKEFIPVFEIEKLQLDFNKFQGVGIIKIDVEGAELEVLTSFENQILEYHPLILIEVLPVYSDENKDRLSRQASIEQLLRKWSYQIYRVDKKEEKFIGLEFVEEIGIHSDMNLCEYVFIPKSEVSKCQSLIISD